MVGELLGALGSARSGVHVELVQDDGRRLAVSRPDTSPHLVVDVDTAQDVSAEFATPDGGIDLLAKEELNQRTARRYLRLTRSDLAASAQSDELIRRLAQAEPTELWSAAARVRVTDDALTKEAEALGSAPEDAEIVDQIERRQHRLEADADANARLRRYATVVGVVALLAGLATAATVDVATGGAMLLIAALTTGVSAACQLRIRRAQADEQQALTADGAESYLGFHLQRVNEILSDGSSRRRLMAVAEDHRGAVSRWTALAGDVSVDWALEHHEEIAAATRLRGDVNAFGAGSNSANSGPDVADDTTADVAHALVSRLTRARSVGSSAEGFPLILDDPFVGLSPAVKHSLLELLGRTAGSPQVILLTEDHDVASWARLEALTGSLSILEPMPEAEPRSRQHLVV